MAHSKTQRMFSERGAPTSGRPSTLQLALALGSIYLIWGTTYLAIRYAIETIPPLLMMSMRHLTAGSVLYAWTRWRGAPAPRAKEWGSAALTGSALFLVGHGGLAWAEQRVPSGVAAVLIATLPMFILLLSRAAATETSFSRRSLAGIALGFAGVLVLFGPDLLGHRDALNVPGAVVILIGNFLWAAGTIWTRKVSLPSSAALTASMQMLAGGTALGLSGALTGEMTHFHPSAVSLQSWLSLAYLAVFGSLVAFTAYTWLHTVEKPSRISTYAYVNPVVAVIVGWAFAGERISGFTVVAMAIILSGVALVNTTKRPPRVEVIETEKAMAAD